MLKKEFSTYDRLGEYITHAGKPFYYSGKPADLMGQSFIVETVANVFDSLKTPEDVKNVRLYRAVSTDDYIVLADLSSSHITARIEVQTETCVFFLELYIGGGFYRFYQQLGENESLFNLFPDIH